jgi:hypothetical protein
MELPSELDIGSSTGANVIFRRGEAFVNAVKKAGNGGNPGNNL